MFSRSVRKCVNELQSLYMQGFIDYPRVDNDYLEPFETMELYPHKPLERLNRSLMPIKNQTLPLNKRNALLYLSQEGLIAPSQAYDYAATIDEYFDEVLEVRDAKMEETLSQVFSLLDDFLSANIGANSKEEQKRVVAQIDNEIYESLKKDDKIAFFSNEIFSFMPNCVTSQRKKKRTPKEIKKSFFDMMSEKEKERYKEELEFRHHRYIDECIKSFQGVQIEIEVNSCLTSEKNSEDVKPKKGIFVDKFKNYLKG